MKKLMEAIQNMALSYVLNILKEKEDEIAKTIASKGDLKWVSEEDEIKIAKGIVSAVSDVLEGLAKKK